MPLGTDFGILLVRVVIGALFIGHGLGKLFGWFGQGGIQGTGAFFESIGYRPGEQLAIFAGIVEVVAGVLLVLGFLVPLAASMIIGDMINAAWYKSTDGFWVADGGFEYEFVLVILVLGLTITGPGAFAIDHKKHWFGGRTGGVVVAVVLGVVSGGIMAFMRA
ncbi:MAG: DoxX family protein [Actinomadura sp.]